MLLKFFEPDRDIKLFVNEIEKGFVSSPQESFILKKNNFISVKSAIKLLH